MAITSKVAAATQNFLMPKLVEGAVDGSSGLKELLYRSKAGVWGGAQEEVPFKWKIEPSGGPFIGFQTLSTTNSENTIKLTYDAVFNEVPVVLSNTDLSLNQTEMQVANLLEREVSSKSYDLGQKLGTQLYGDGSGFAAPALTGLAAGVDDGTSVSTIGGQSRSTYTALQATKTASGGTLTLAKMFTLYDAASEGAQVPDLVLTTKTIRSLYNQLLQPKERYTDPNSLSTGAKVLMFRDAKVVADSLATSGVLWMLNTNSFTFKVMSKYEGGKQVNFRPEEMDGEPMVDVPKGMGFFHTDWVKSQNQEAIVKRVIHAGNLVWKNPRYNGQLTGITSI